MQQGSSGAPPNGIHYEYDPDLKRTVEVTPTGQRFAVTLVDGKLVRDSERLIAQRKSWAIGSIGSSGQGNAGDKYVTAEVRSQELGIFLSV